MVKSSDVLQNIREHYPKLSKGQKLLAQYITEHFDKAVYLTASRLGATVGVSESTVVRFANELGYDGYPDLQRSLEELVKNKLTSLQRIQVLRERDHQGKTLHSVLQSDIENIKTTLDKMDEAEFQKTVDLLNSARRIYILGVRSCAALSQFLGFYLNFICDDVRQIKTSGVSDTFEQMLTITSQDVFIGISFPRYSKRTVKMMEFARSRGASCIAITDSEMSPLYAMADSKLLCCSDMVSFADSLVAPLSMINALIVAMSREKQQEIERSLSELEAIWKEYEVYDSEDSSGTRYGDPIL